MKIAMTTTSVRLVLNGQERGVFLQKFGEAARLTFDWHDQGRLFLVRPQKVGEHGSTLYQKDAGKSPDTWEMSWSRVSKSHDHSRLPTFGTCSVEGYSYADKGLRIVVPPEKDRPRPQKYERNGKSEKDGHGPSVPTAAPSQVTVIDLLDRLRTYRDKLNELRARHPENITFKVRPDGTLGFEFLADE